MDGAVNGIVDDIAVVGLACRLPQAPDPAALWRLLREGRDAITDVPDGRWTIPADPAFDGMPRRGGFLDRVDAFDAPFFELSPAQAAAMDPQQRLTLELGWEALEDAGIVPGQLAGSRAGVFIGATWNDYAALVDRGGPGALNRHSITGINRGVIANHLSYLLGLHGPSLVVDSAQSSALVAVHLAVESLRRGESDLALAGGVNLALTAEGTLAAWRFGALSPDGRSYTFDERANGYVRGEGGGVVVLRPLRSALAAGNPIYCVIRGGAVVNDGATEGLTVPGLKGQTETLREAYRQAGVDPRTVDYVELHGTGTAAGDPIEAAALAAVLGRGRPARRLAAAGRLGQDERRPPRGCRRHRRAAQGGAEPAPRRDPAEPELRPAESAHPTRRAEPAGADRPDRVAAGRRGQTGARRCQLLRHGRDELPRRGVRAACGNGPPRRDGARAASDRPSGRLWQLTLCQLTTDRHLTTGYLLTAGRHCGSRHCGNGHRGNGHRLRTGRGVAAGFRRGALGGLRPGHGRPARRRRAPRGPACRPARRGPACRRPAR
nr:beta-ketoacyl synthase N-terminal-like domain-containing protein [Protofrankia coriariae]